MVCIAQEQVEVNAMTAAGVFSEEVKQILKLGKGRLNKNNAL